MMRKIKKLRKVRENPRNKKKSPLKSNSLKNQMEK
jgi:hypothetical protein